MKKLTSLLAIAAVALTAVFGFSSCSKDDPEPEDVKNYAKYTAKITEDIFAFFDVNVIIEVDGKQNVYTFGEDTKVSDMKIERIDVLHPEMSKAGRILVVPVFEFGSRPIRFATKLTLNEAGKQKIANAKDEDTMNFFIDLDYGECDKNGAYINQNHVTEYIDGAGPYLKTLEEYMTYYYKLYDLWIGRIFV